MRADICDPSDANAFERFRRTLKRMGAKLEDQAWGIGTDIQLISIGESGILVFSDNWSIDIEGPDDLVQKILQEFRGAAI